MRASLALIAALTLAAPARAATTRHNAAPTVTSKVPLAAARLRVLSIPPFARLYRTSCTTCHTAPPKLNVLGEAFRLNGYRMPENSKLFVREAPVPLGEDPWKDLWPRAIYPGTIAGSAPVAVRVELDVEARRASGKASSVSYGFPQEVYLLAGGQLGDQIGVFVESSWEHGEGFSVIQAKVAFNDPLRWLPARALNVWVGLQDLHLVTLGAREIDRAGRELFLWQTFRFADVRPRNPRSGAELESPVEFQLVSPQPSVELNGILARRLYYGVGVAQGTTEGADDANNHKDVYYKLRYKLGGLALDGSYDPGGGPRPGGYGQLMERGALVVEQFGYFGSEPTSGGREDRHLALGGALRLQRGPLDLGAGYMWARDDDPWAAGSAGTFASVFGKAEYLARPWVIGSLKAERLRVRPAAEVTAKGYTAGTGEQARVLPGVVLLVRPNVRLVVEGELYTRHDASAERGRPRPHALRGRLDIAF